MRDRDSASRKETADLEVTKDAGAGAASPAGPHHRLVDLQRRVGNRAVGELLGVGQPKLAVGASDDRYEREADAIARTVVAFLDRGTDGGERGIGDDELHAGGDARSPVRRLRDAGAEVGAEGGELSAETETDIQRARGGGVPLGGQARANMERAFGTDFGGVRLHAGREASSLNERVQAKAFTIGDDVFFRDALPDASTKQGQELLAHELAHTVQQGTGRSMARKVESTAVEPTRTGREPPKKS
ncbi:MAG: DUF4157 domain-containing protein [Acidimicrobiales bacterium]